MYRESDENMSEGSRRSHLIVSKKPQTKGGIERRAIVRPQLILGNGYQ